MNIHAAAAAAAAAAVAAAVDNRELEMEIVDDEDFGTLTFGWALGMAVMKTTSDVVTVSVESHAHCSEMR